MKNLVTTLILSCVALLAYSAASAQTIWEKYSGNPILVGGPSGTWDQFGVLAIGMLFDSATVLSRDSIFSRSFKRHVMGR